MKQQTNNKWKLIAIALIATILISGIAYLDYKAMQEKYNKGYETGVNQTIQEIALSQVQTGNILITNGTAITTIPITEICQNILDAQEVKK